MKILWAVNRDPDVFITLSDTDTPVPVGGVVEHKMTINLVEGIIPILHTAGWQPSFASIQWPEGTLLKGLPLTWWIDTAYNPTSVIYINSDDVYTDAILTLYK